MFPLPMITNSLLSPSPSPHVPTTVITTTSSPPSSPPCPKPGRGLIRFLGGLASCRHALDQGEMSGETGECKGQQAPEGAPPVALQGRGWRRWKAEELIGLRRPPLCLLQVRPPQRGDAASVTYALMSSSLPVPTTCPNIAS